MDYIIEAYELKVILGGRVVLDIPFLGVLRGEVLVLMGPNGVGKSTLLSTLALLQKPSSGWLTFNGERIDKKTNPLFFRRRMAAIFQEPLLLDTTVRENVSLGLKLRNFPRRQREERVRHWMERFNISHLSNRSARTLSGGEAQRASLARAFALEPEVLFMDEPFSSLDRHGRAALISDLEKNLVKRNITVVMVTQDREEARILGDRVGVLLDGKLRQIDRTEVVFQSPADEDIDYFLGGENLLRRTVVA